MPTVMVGVGLNLNLSPSCPTPIGGWDCWDMDKSLLSHLMVLGHLGLLLHWRYGSWASVSNSKHKPERASIKVQTNVKQLYF
jgi:hypothetical protein